MIQLETMRFSIRTFWIAGIVCSLAACSDDPVSVEPFALDGNWTYSAVSLTGILPEHPDAFPGIKLISVTCRVAPTPMVLTGSNDAFGGRFSAATVVCELLNKVGGLVDTEVLGPVDGTVEQGQVNDDAVSFGFSPETGSISTWSNEGRSMERPLPAPCECRRSSERK